MLQILGYEIYSVMLDNFSLDGGAMFGAVPKVIWDKLQPSDPENRIKLCSRALVLEGHGRRILMELGCGSWWDDKFKKNFNISNLYQGSKIRELGDFTDIILTHLHFDHAGGLLFRNSAGNLEPSFPNATYWISSNNLSRASSPGSREAVSYNQEIVSALKKLKFNEVNESSKIDLPNVKLEELKGHTAGMLLFSLVEGGTRRLIFTADLIPTSSHLRIPYVMGYDLCAETTMNEKIGILDKAVTDNSILVFGHDIKISSASVIKESEYKYSIKSLISTDKI